MVGLGASRLNEFVARFGREWKVGEVIAVEMPELDLAESKLDAAETVRVDGDTVPTRHRLLNRLARSVHIWSNMLAWATISGGRERD